MSLSIESPSAKKKKGCKHTKRNIRGYITVEIRQFNASPELSRKESALKTDCTQCKEEEKEATRRESLYSYNKDIKVSRRKIHTPLNYQELQSYLAMILPVSFGMAVVEKQENQIVPWETFAIQDGDTVVVREIRPPCEDDQVYQNIEWKNLDYEKVLSNFSKTT
jgi:hypothetical protein